MVSVDNKLPKTGRKIKCKVNVWRYGVNTGIETMIASYGGKSPLTNKPMANDGSEEHWLELLEWEYIQ